MEMILYRKGEAFTVLYDECDHEVVSNYKWLITTDGYVLANFNGTYAFMHRLIMNPQDGFFIDHKNRVKHDNRRENLRICTKSENQRNHGLNINSTTGYKGVSKSAESKKFAAFIKACGNRIYLGKYHTAEEAARAYDKAARELHGEFANPNFPD